jgi:DNA repair photolyase
MKKFKDRPEDWGQFVDVKVNAPEALERQIQRLKKNPKKRPNEASVFMGSVGDCWQPVEAKYKLSRACLGLLLEAGFKVDILTKSALVCRDLELLEAYKTPRLGMTLTTLDLGLQKALEPQASEPLERLETLRKAGKKGIKTWAFLGPLIPGITDTRANLDGLFRGLRGLRLAYIYVDRLNPRWGVLEALKRGLSRGEGYLDFRHMLYTASNPKRYAEYSQRLKENCLEAAGLAGLADKLTFCF